MLLLAYYAHQHNWHKPTRETAAGSPQQPTTWPVCAPPLPGPGSAHSCPHMLQLWLLQSTKFSKSISLLQYLNLKKKVKQPLPNPSSTLSLRSHLPGFQQILALQNS